MHKATGFAIANGFSNRSGSDGGGKGHGAAGQRFAQTQNVGGNPGVFTSEQLAGAAKAGGNLIGDQQYPFPVAHFARPLQPLRMVHPHAARPLDDRFEDHRGDFVTMRGHQAGKRYHIHLVPLAVKAALRRGGEQVIRQVALPQAVHRDSADRRPTSLRRYPRDSRCGRSENDDVVRL